MINLILRNKNKYQLTYLQRDLPMVTFSSCRLFVIAFTGAPTRIRVHFVAILPMISIVFAVKFCIYSKESSNRSGRNVFIHSYCSQRLFWTLSATAEISQRHGHRLHEIFTASSGELWEVLQKSGKTEKRKHFHQLLFVRSWSLSALTH